MRSVLDGEGRRWDVVPGRESWGSQVALFLPVEGDGGIRRALLPGDSAAEAARALDAMDPAALEALFLRSEPLELDVGRTDPPPDTGTGE